MQFPVPSETFASNDIECLRSQGHDVTVYGLRCRHPLYDSMVVEREHGSLSINHFSMKAIWLSFLYALCNPSITASLIFWVFRCCFLSPRHFIKSVLLIPSVLNIYKELSENRPDVVHLFWGHYPSMVGFLVSKYCPEIVLSMFLGAHDLISEYPGSSYMANHSDCLFTHSKSNLCAISAISTANANVVFRGTNLENGSLASLNKFSNLDKPIFVVAARLIEGKGVDQVLQVFKQIVNDYPGAFLKIAGNGPELLNLQRIAQKLSVEDRVEFLGHISQANLKEQMASAHFFLLLSMYPAERLPNVVKEAMFQKCVVVTTNTTGIDELVDNDINGYVVPLGDIDGAESYIRECLNNTHKATSLAMNAQQNIVRKFDVKKSMSAYLAVWNRCLQSKRQGS